MDLSHTHSDKGMGEMKGAIAAGVLGVLLAVALFQSLTLFQPSIPSLEPLPREEEVGEAQTLNKTAAADIMRQAVPEMGGAPQPEAVRDGLVFSYPLVAGLSLLVAGLAYILFRRTATRLP